MKKDVTYDINQLPQEAGMLVFGISMSRISNAQDAKQCFAYMKQLAEKIVKTQGVGLTLLYTDGLYLHSDKSSEVLRKKHLGAIVSHAKGFQKILGKNVSFIPQAFSYLMWFQMIIHTENFLTLYGLLIKLYEKDSILQNCVLQDTGKTRKAMTNHDKEFVLEESLALYLMTKGKTEFSNEFLHGKEQWILQCYPGKPLMTEAYLAQKNPFKLHNPKNRYEYHTYDLEKRKLYDLQTIVLPS